MTLIHARVTDLREVHSRSIHGTVTTPSAPSRPLPLQALLGRLRARFADAGRARALRRELEALGDTALADLGIARPDIRRHVARAMHRRRRPVAQDLRDLSPHLLADLAVSVRAGNTRVYTSVPLGVVTGRVAPGAPANREAQRKTA